MAETVTPKRGSRYFLAASAPWFAWGAAIGLVPATNRPAFVTIGLAFLLATHLFPELWWSPVAEFRERKRSVNRIHLVALSAALVVVWWVYRDLFSGGWMSDDARLLRAVAENGVLAHFFEPTAWRALSGSFFTPLLTASFWLDFRIFDLRVGAFYMHQLLAFSLVLGLLFVLGRRWFTSAAAILCVPFFAFSTASATVLQQLMTRHYLEGLLWLLLLALLLASDEGGAGWGRGCLAAACALMSMSSKEVFVPLVAMAAAAPWVFSWRRRVAVTLPIAGSIVLVLLWRIVMLGFDNSGTAYGSLGGGLPTWNEDLRQLVAMAGVNTIWQGLLWVGVAVAAVLGGLRALPWRSCVFWGGVVTACVVGLIPVLGNPAPRYLWLPSLAWALSATLVVDRLARRGWVQGASALAALVVASGLCAVDASPLWRDRQYIAAEAELAEFVLREGPSDAVVMSHLGSPLSLHSLDWLRRHHLGLGAAPRVCADPCACELRGGEPLYRVTPAGIVPRGRFAAAGAENCGEASAALELSLLYRPRKASLSWTFGPYQEGRFQYAGPGGKDHVSGHFMDVPAQGEIPMTLHETLVFVVRYESPAGWHTYSPKLRLVPDPERADDEIVLQWQRPSAIPEASPEKPASEEQR